MRERGRATHRHVPRRRTIPARIEAFSDGVFSIVITLLRCSMCACRAMRHCKARRLQPRCCSNGRPISLMSMSFLQVGWSWANHHMMFHHIRRSDHVLLVYNPAFAAFYGRPAFTTSLLTEYAYRGKADFTLAALL